MTTTTTVQQSNQQNYFEQLNKANTYYTTQVQPQATDLSARIRQPLTFLTPQVQKHILENNLILLRDGLIEGLKIYDAISKGHAVAKAALECLNTTLGKVPEKIELPVEIVTHLTQLNVMDAVVAAKENCTTERERLKAASLGLTKLITKADVFMQNMLPSLDSIAYHVKRIEKKTGVLDYLPSRGYYYFDEALAAFRNPPKVEQLTPSANGSTELKVATSTSA
jgi:hypothetical protein